jgi:hypothetical protein
MTTLSHLQAEIGARLLAGAGAPGAGTPGAGTPAERAGWPVTRALYRNGRVSRIRALAPLTLARLGVHAELAVDAYLAANPGAAAHAAGFLEFAAAARPDDRYLAEITFLELALIRVRQPEPAGGAPPAGYLGRSRLASLRTVAFPPDSLLAWLSGHGDRPVETPGVVLVAPGVAGWVRAATEAEARVWHWLAMDRPVRGITAAMAEPVRTLRLAGAVR